MIETSTNQENIVFQESLTNLVKSKDVQIQVASACFRDWADDELARKGKESLTEADAYLANPLFTQDEKLLLMTNGVDIADDKKPEYYRLQNILSQNIASMSALFTGLNYLGDAFGMNERKLLEDIAKGDEDQKARTLLQVMANSNWMVTMHYKNKSDSEKIKPFNKLSPEVKMVDTKQVKACASVLLNNL